MTHRIVACLALAALLAAGGCSESPSTWELTPTGTPPQPPATGSISGTLLFPGDTTPPYPVATVYAVLDADASCRSLYTSVHITGSYTTPPWDSNTWAETPGMIQVAGCVWFETVTLPAGELAWKFVLNKNWDPSYGTASGYKGLEGTTELVTGTGTELKADIPARAEYTFILDESEIPVAYRIVPRAEAPVGSSEAQTGNFKIENLPNGTYTIAIFAEGFPTRRLTGVQVTGGETKLGSISLSGAIVGRVLFEGAPSPRPTATIDVRAAGTSTVLATADTDSAFSFSGLDTGTYDLDFEAYGFRDTTVAAVAFTEGNETNLGDVTMRRAGAGAISGRVLFQGTTQPPYPVATVYAFTGVSTACTPTGATVHVTGNYNNWDNTTWNTTSGMRLVTNCIWVETIALDPTALSTYGAGVLGWKFIVDKQWDPAYGRPTGEPTGLKGRTALVSGEGTHLQATIPQAGNWVFILNETGKPDDVQYRIVLEEDAPLGVSDAGTRLFTVDRLDPGTYEIIVTAPGYQTAKIREVPLSGNSFNVGDVSLAPLR
jgi:hypothetical protein